MPLELQRIFEIAGTFFQVLLSTIFYKMSGTLSETFLTLSLLGYNIFLKKTAGFCFRFFINRKFKKVLTSFLACLALWKNKNSKASRMDHPPLSNVIFLYLFGVCVLFIYTISMSNICVWQEELSLIASNEQIYTFYKGVIF